MPYTRLLTTAAWLMLPLAAMAQAPAPASAPAPVPITVRSVLDQARQASGGPAWDRLTTSHDQGTGTLGGLSGTYDNWLDWVHVKQAESYVLGPASGTQGWDGHRSWSIDASKQVRVESSAEAISGAVEQAYFATYAMYFPGRYPADIALAGTRLANGVSYQALTIKPLKSDPVELWFDPVTHLPARMVELTGGQPHTTLYSEYHDVAGVKLPFHVVTRTGNDPKYDQITQTESFAATMVPDATFAPPPPPVYDASFPAGKTAVTVAFRLLNNHIYLPVAIDGNSAVPFMFDTGATNVLDTTHAKSLGIAMQGTLPGGGFGSQIAAIGLARVARVALAGMTLHDQVFASYDLASLAHVEGMDLVGLIGYEFVKRAVVTIDYSHNSMTLTRPDTFHPPSGAVAVPFTFNAHVPMIKAAIDGVPGEFEVDTGARGGVTIMHPFSVANHFVDTYHATLLATTGYGVGGPSRALLGRAGVLTIGSLSIPHPVLDLVVDARGAAAAEHTSGNLGGDILKRFTLTLDYGHQLLYLQPNALASQPEIFDRSGLWINRATDGMIEISDVTASSAARKAGLNAGDRISIVNGNDVRTIELYQLRETFKAPPGTHVTLRVKGADGKTRRVVLTLADQV